MTFDEACTQLNPQQKQAVDAIEGPVMVIAGPGTGKTQVLALRIANILTKTDTQADGILCLTFTNPGVRAMRERLRSYIGAAASRVEVSTFHSFGMKMIEEFYEDLGLVEQPKLIDDAQAIALCDEILHSQDWQHIRTRSNPSAYFKDIRSLVSLLKRERMTPQTLGDAIDEDITFLHNDDSSISTRGPSKGKIKQEVLRKIESLERTREIVRFYELYEQLKQQRNLFDYDDVLENLVKLVDVSENATATIRERYLYVLVDEHQDSSGVQNEFLARVWGDAETQNVFVVGDDRQLIYGFGGASLSYFEGFKETFHNVVVITLTGNYRSTQAILDTADALLQSSLADAPLVSHSKEHHPLRIVEAQYPRDEIIRAGIEIQERIANGTDPSQCALLVSKNAHVRTAVRILQDMGLPVSAGNNTTLFETAEAQSLLLVLEVLSQPLTPHGVARMLFDPIATIPPIAAHQFISTHDSRKLTLVSLLEEKQTLGLYVGEDAVTNWAQQLSQWLDYAATGDIKGLIQTIAAESLLNNALDHETLVRRIEIVRTFIHLAQAQVERNPHITLSEFVDFLKRLQEYGAGIPIAVFGGDSGIQVMTLHGSKGLEFDYVWIAHVDQRTVMGSAAGAFTLPTFVKERMEEHDEAVVKRQIYVAITRAKRFCTLSYAITSYAGAVQELAHVVADLPEHLFERISAHDTETYITQHDPLLYVTKTTSQQHAVTLSELAKLVAKDYDDRKVSVTLLNNFFSCPWKWYFRSLLQLPEEQSPSLIFGSIVHNSIEHILKQKLSPNKQQLQSIVDMVIEKFRGLSEADTKRMRTDAIAIVGRWVQHRLPTIINYESEKALSCRDRDFDHLLITGKIDLLERLGDHNVRVTDFKTGSTKTSRDIEKSDDEGRMSDLLRQLAMYSYLIRETSKGDTIVAESQLEFVEDDSEKGLYTTVVNNDTIERLRDDMKDYDQLVKTGEWINRPCNFKPFKNATECPYCKLANIYKK